ncbi:MAG: hypothetical protein QOE76_1763, partial [Frankiales bacterium]|nr:hypothetical protein [Frankiales bacterium]
MAAKGPGPRPRGDYPTFKDVAKAVRRYRPSDLLPALARVSAAISDRDENSLEVWVSQASPWGLAALARESLTGGSEDRRHKRVDQADVLALHAMFAASYDESPDDETKSVLSIMTRHAYEQFPYQESDWDEVARTFALLDGALRASSTTTLTVGTLENMLGGQLDVVLRAAVILWGAAKESSGAWDPRWIYSTEASELVEKTPADAVTALAVKLTSTMQAMRRDAVAVPAPAPHLRRYAYNPLQSTPIVKLQRGALILPQTRMVLRRLSPGGLFYEGMRTLGPNFANDLGKVVETYVGQVLALVTGASVHPEVPYAKGSLSVDWFLVMDDLVVLVESKSMRATLGARAGDVDLIPSLQEKLNHALEQL